VPDISVRAVLDPENGLPGRECRAFCLCCYIAEHNVNAKKYSDWINSQGVKDSFENYFGYFYF
jgi:hypothetical protein